MVTLNKNNTIYYVHNDMTNTPRAITSANSSSSQPIWGWTLSDPYGDNEANGSIVFNPRFMGQYYDIESGLHYNYHRYYSPKLGRYIQSDPIGLAGGWNTYNYVENNPLNAVDPLGLLKQNSDGTYKSIRTPNFDRSFFDSERQTHLNMQAYNLFTDLGNPIQAFKITPSKKSYIYNYNADCHGWTFTKGQYWINNDQVYKILNDEYYQIFDNQVQTGDAIIYRNFLNISQDPIGIGIFNLSNINHSLTAIKTDKGVYGYGKGGSEPYPYLQNSDSFWDDNIYETKSYYRKK
jgi:RHS repeat-associated protein